MDLDGTYDNILIPKRVPQGGKLYTVVYGLDVIIIIKDL